VPLALYNELADHAERDRRSLSAEGEVALALGLRVLALRRQHDQAAVEQAAGTSRGDT
jgi:hypothetical protein